ncbi:hypothetical protein ACC778_33565 [Rhizobium ruizarguesonis]|uniref:hypothetical protein n=1 Tax=Rhizobium ruizarguesonis TaxID=2081791 RepID=UPI0016399075|nr:hypothetical protein [Rhizobium ruizarguesonis]MBC2802380.1 hypothetical protein [Rhizobium ruizarguesonis]
MTVRILLDTSDGQRSVFHERISSGRLIRIDVRNIRLEPGEALEFKLAVTSGLNDEKTELEPFHFVGDDPKPAAGANFSLQVRADRGDLFSVAATAESSGQHAFDNAQFIAVYESDQWISYLPAVYREDPKHADFLSRFLGGLFIDGERIEEQLDRVGNLVVPSRLPTLAAARYLAGWFGIDLDLVLPELKAGKNDQKKKDEHEAASLEAARRFLTRIVPHALGSGTADSVLAWIDAAAEARGMSEERRRSIALVEGFNVRRLFTLQASHDPRDPDPTEIRAHRGWLPGSGVLATEPLARRAFLDQSKFSEQHTLGLPGETGDSTLLARLLGSRLWLFVPAPVGGEPDTATWERLLKPILPAHLALQVIAGETSSELGYNTVLGVATKLPSQRSLLL